MRNAVAALLTMAAVAGPANAQTARPMLDYASAARIRDGCVAWASERKLAVAIAVYDERGTMLAYALMDGAATAVADYAQWKGRSAATIHVASAETANWGRGPAQLATWEGGTPVFSTEGVPLGGVGVSGAESAEDSACGQAGVAAAGLKSTKD
ncbi:MAG TPA: heme-binding protein [Croceibacterium sp.]|nr:heme-binding protein [Croceibacterium sp.]